MPLVSRSCIENIKSRVDIQDVVGTYVQLKKVGTNWRGLSPFSQEKTASFYVLPEKNIFKCFSSGYAGDIFRFLELKENLNFQEAIETLAHRYNIPLEFEEGSHGEPRGVGSNKKDLFDIHEQAANYFHQCFIKEEAEGIYIRKYWEEERGFTLDFAKEHIIGLAPAANNRLIDLLLNKKFSIESIKASGLFYARDQDTNPQFFKPRFRGRLMIPIRDVQGRVIAFAGRKLEITPDNDPAKEAKYINSPETPIFHKSRVLYGLDDARKHVEKTGYLLLAEGQLDVLRCRERGYNTAIAPQGTSITENQLSIIRRYTNNLNVILDGDSAGQKAAMRLIPMAFAASIEPRFIKLPEGMDPDSLLRKPSGSLDEDIKNSQSAMEFAVTSLVAERESLSGGEKNLILNELFTFLLNCESQVSREEQVTEICKLLNLTQSSVKEDFESFRRRQSKKTTVRENLSIEKKGQNKSSEKLTSVEYQLLLIILSEEDIGQALAKVIQPEWITTETIQAKLLLRILGEISEEVWEGVSGIHQVVENEEEKNFIYSLLSEELPFENIKKSANLCVGTLYKNFIQKKQKKIDESVNSCDPKDLEGVRRLQTERMNVRKMLQQIPNIVS